MFKNVASQKVTFLVIDTAANTPKTGDAANLTGYVSKDDGAVTVLGDTAAAELDATNAPGLYTFDVAQGETNADKLVFSGKSSTSGIRVVPLLIYTRASNINDLVIDGSGNITGNLVGTVSTVTTLTNLPAITASWLTATGIANGAITAEKIATGAIDADAIADGAIDAGAIADGAITAAKLATGAITAAKFAAGAIDATAIATNAITSDQLAGSAVTEIQSGLATAANVSAVEADTQDIQARLPAALVSGRMVSQTAAMADGVILAATIAAAALNGKGDWATTGAAMTLASGERDSIAAALLDLADGVESGVTLRKAMRAMAAVLAGDATGAGTLTEAYKAIGNSGTTRVTPNADGDGNRTGVTLNL